MVSSIYFCLVFDPSLHRARSLPLYSSLRGLLPIHFLPHFSSFFCIALHAPCYSWYYFLPTYLVIHDGPQLHVQDYNDMHRESMV
jgi:hypothetical protein